MKDIQLEEIRTEITKVLVQPIKNLNTANAEILQTLKRAYPNFVKVYTLSGTGRQKLNFQLDTNNTPISIIKIINSGGGLTIWVNSSDSFTVLAGDIIPPQGAMEIGTFEYQLTSDSATIMVFARVDK